MKKIIPTFILATVLMVSCKDMNGSIGTLRKVEAESATVTLFDNVLFYTGYDELNNSPVTGGVKRVSNVLYVKKLTDAELALIGTNLTMDINMQAGCDNYDRIARVYLSLVKKGEDYNENTANHFEIGRFITPFMNKNAANNNVPFSFNIDNLSSVLRDETLQDEYDIWFGFSVFGASYAAQNEVAGCAGRNDTFYGTLKLTSNGGAQANQNPVHIKSVSYMKLQGDGNDNELNFNNRTALGAEKTYTINLDKPMNNASMFLITSSHGAASQGEEYVRRTHHIYFDEQLKLTYIPGGKSCEPFRQYNTQGNGIYGPSPRSDASWASFSNWCPGDVIPIREIGLGNLAAGSHTFKIVVEEAKFNNNSGTIPVAAYLQGTN